MPDLPPELREIFALEANEHNQAIQTGLELLRHQPGDMASLSEMRRVTHTLKGAAASVGFARLAHMAHLMEEILDRHLEANAPLIDSVVNLLFDTADVLGNLIEPDQAVPLDTLFETVDRQYVELLGDAYPQPPQVEAVVSHGRGTETPSTVRAAENMLRLSLATMDALINRVGEIIINRSGLERQMGDLRTLLAELDRTTKRLRQVVHNIDAQVKTTLPIRAGARENVDPTFDPLELDRYSLLYQFTRELEEIAADASDLHSHLHFLASDLDAGMTHERHLTTELQDSLLETRLVPFYELETRVRRTVRRTASDLGKSVDVILTGFDTTVDKAILDTLADPVMHLLRNAVDHGIEAPHIRRAANKPATGLITLNVSRERGRVVLTLSDDGAGIDLKKVHQRANALGRQVSEQQLLDLLFEEGFSLAETVTQTSGRGVGLDIVRRAVNRLQGMVRVETQVGRGTTFIISVPVTLAITQALFIRSCNQEFAVPLEQVAVVLRLESDFLDEIQKEGVLRYEGRALAIRDLAEFVGGPNARSGTPRYGLITETGDRGTVVLTEGMIGIHEAVVKSLGSHLRRVFGVAGATIAGDGRVTLILDLMEFVAAEQGASHTDGPVQVVRAQSVAEAPCVLVVDDSPSVRRVVCAFLERAGWQTVDAKDGIDALEKLGSIRADAALVDIEMPRMNGYELLARIKSDASLRHIPVIFLTSRSASKHRERAAQLQVDGYLVKPYRENELLEELTRVIRR